MKDTLLKDLTPDRKAYLDSITDELTDMSNETVKAIITSVGSTNIPPEAYEIVSRTIAKEFAIIVAASMLDDGECCSDPKKFIQEVWRSCGGK